MHNFKKRLHLSAVESLFCALCHTSIVEASSPVIRVGDVGILRQIMGTLGIFMGI